MTTYDSCKGVLVLDATVLIVARYHYLILLTKQLIFLIIYTLKV